MREAIGESIETVDFWPACHVMKEHNLEADLKYDRSMTESQMIYLHDPKI